METQPHPIPKRILVVDDEPALRDLFSIALEAGNREIVTCPDGKTALSRTKKSRFDLILLDLRMPDLSGIDVLSRMRNRDDFTRVVLCSAYIPERSLLEALRLGVTTFISKPVTLAVLRKITENALNHNWRNDLAPALELAEKLNFSAAARILAGKKKRSNSMRLSIWEQLFRGFSEGRDLDDLLPQARKLAPLAVIKS